MSESSSQARALADAAIMMAKAEGNLPGWSDALMQLATEVSGVLLAKRGISRQEMGQALNEHCATLAQHLSDPQRVFVSSLAERNRLELLPEIAAAFRLQLDAGRQEPTATSTSTAPGRAADTAPVSFSSFELVDPDDARLATPVPVVEVKAGIEAIGHLCKKICAIWGTRELDLFLNQLVMDSRDGGRKGLPVDAASEIVFLSGLNKMVRAIELAKTSSLKLEEAYRLVEEGDEAMYRTDVWDNPNASRDSINRRAKAAVEHRREMEAEPRSQLVHMIELLVMLVTNKFVIGIIILALAAKFFLR